MTDENTFHGEHRRELQRAIEAARKDSRHASLAAVLVLYSLGFFFGGLTVGLLFWFTS
jgi:hypothetical protein